MNTKHTIYRPPPKTNTDNAINHPQINKSIKQIKKTKPAAKTESKMKILIGPYPLRISGLRGGGGNGGRNQRVDAQLAPRSPQSTPTGAHRGREEPPSHEFLRPLPLRVL